MITSLDKIKIKNFIFHVVHHKEDEPILMEETPITGYEMFFKLRIQEVLEGNQFNFVPGSIFLSRLESIKNKVTFLEVSKELACLFHENKSHDKRIKPGVLILMKAEIEKVEKFILIKYDHEKVLYYTRKGNSALLGELTNTFSRNKESLQKSAVIDLNGPVKSAIIVDKSERSHITRFFKDFLSLKRTYDLEILTEKVRESYLNTVKEFKDLLPSDYTGNASQTFYNFVQGQEVFDVDTFLPSIFGGHFISAMSGFFMKELRKKDIPGEKFTFNKDIRKPKTRKYRTAEGVGIQLPIDADDTMEINYADTKTIVTITTSQLIEVK